MGYVVEATANGSSGGFVSGLDAQVRAVPAAEAGRRERKPGVPGDRRGLARLRGGGDGGAPLGAWERCLRRGDLERAVVRGRLPRCRRLLRPAARPDLSGGGA